MFIGYSDLYFLNGKEFLCVSENFFIIFLFAGAIYYIAKMIFFSLTKMIISFALTKMIISFALTNSV